MLNPSSSSTHHQPQPIISTLTQTCIQLITQFILTIIKNKNKNTSSTHQTQFDQIYHFIFNLNQLQPKISSEQFKPIIQSILNSINHQNLHQSHNLQHDHHHHHHHQLPFVLYLAILNAYQDLTIFNFNSTQSTSSSKNRRAYSDLVLKDEAKLKILFDSNLNLNSELKYLTILNLSWYSTFSNQDLNIIHQSLKHSLIILRLDYTSISDLGIWNLTHELNSNRIDSSKTNWNEIDLNYLNPNRSSSNWFQLTFLTLKGLKSITDRSLKYLSKFPNLTFIDLNQTSCTQASRQILNQSIIKSYQSLHSSDHPSTPMITLKQFNHPKSTDEIDFFLGKSNWIEKFDKFLKIRKMKDSAKFEWVQIDWIQLEDQPHRFQSDFQSSKLHQSKAFFHKSNQFEPIETSIDLSLCLMIQYPLKSIQLHHPLNHQTSSSLDFNQQQQSFTLKRNRKSPKTLILDDDLSLLVPNRTKKTKM
ncbi:hypothetical protein DFH28DRAFT_357781 [Melampsora americana]|nr:hypothetical protein DFH28DRAFT_357781 [Melampsora americana]